MSKHAWALLLCVPLLFAGCGGGSSGGDGGSNEPTEVLAITTQPEDKSVVSGASVTFEVTARNASAYRWQRNDSGDWVDIEGATSRTLTLSAVTPTMDGLQLRVIIDGAGTQLISSAVTLSVSNVAVAVSISVQPTSQTELAGSDATFNVTATGTSLAYRWQISDDCDADWTDIVDATTSQLRVEDIDASQDGQCYRVQVSNSLGSETSDAATLSVQAVPVAPAIATQPADVAVVEGQNAVFTVSATGVPAPQVQWQLSIDGGSTWSNIVGADSASYAITAVPLSADGHHLRAVAVNDEGSVNSRAARLTVMPAPVEPAISSQPVSVSVLAGATYSFTAAATGTPVPALQWQQSVNAIDWRNINGATTAAYTAVPATVSDNGRLYRLVATNSVGTAISNLVSLTVTPTATVTSSLALFPGSFSGVLGGSGALDGTGSAVRLGHAGSMAFDATDNLVFADVSGSTIRKMSPSFAVTTLAGFYKQQAHIDGLGASARLSGPAGIAMDGAGNVYVADEYNQAVRKLSPGGTVTTIARLDRVGGIEANSSGVLFVSDNNCITRIAVDGTTSTLAGLCGVAGHADGTGSDARFDGPRGLALAFNDDLIVAEFGSNVIRRVTPAGVVSTIAGLAYAGDHVDGVGSAARFGQPVDVAVNQLTDEIYVADSSWRLVRKIYPGTNAVTTIAGGGSSTYGDGPTSLVRFTSVSSVEIGPGGFIYIGDGSRIRTLHEATSMVATVAGARRTSWGTVSGVVTDSAGNVYASDQRIHVIRKFHPDGSVDFGFGGPGSTPGSADGPGTSAQFSSPAGLAIDASDRVYVADRDNSTIRVIQTDGTVSTLAGSPGVTGSSDGVGSAARFQSPAALAVDGSGAVYVADIVNHTIRKVLPNGTVSTFSGLAGTAGAANGAGSTARYDTPSSIAVDGSGRVYVADQSGAIRRISTSGVASTFAGALGETGRADGPPAAARFGSNLTLAWADGMLHVLDNDNGTLRVVDASGNVSTIAGMPGQIGMRLGADPRFNLVGGMAPMGANKLVLTGYEEQAIVVLTK
jgi:sugar lactone lactonase YvrE